MSAPWTRLVVVAVVVAGGMLLARWLGVPEALALENLGRVKGWFDGLGRAAPVVFIAGYALAELCFVPGLPLTVLAGIVFGPVRGTIYASVGAIIGAALAFLAARYAMRDVIARWAARHPRWAGIDRAVARHGWRVLVFTRLVPLFPFNVQNFAYGLTGIGFWPFVGISWLCILPGTAVFAFAGSALVEGRGDVKRLLLYVGIAGLLIAALSLVPRWLTRRSRVRGDLIGGGNGPESF